MNVPHGSTPQTPRALALVIEQQQQTINRLGLEGGKLMEENGALIIENANLRRLLGEACDDVDKLLAQYENLKAVLVRDQADVVRFIWWFHNGHNVDEQLFELNRRRALDPKSVTLDMWRTALDAAMEKKKCSA